MQQSRTRNFRDSMAQMNAQVLEWLEGFGADVEHLRQSLNLDCALELQYETHYQRFLMPTIRGAEEGSKKRYAGLAQGADGELQMIYKGLESVRTDWSPLARQFQQGLYERIAKLEETNSAPEGRD